MLAGGPGKYRKTAGRVCTAEAMLRDYKINKRKSLKTVQERWRLHLQPYFEEIPAEKLTTDQVEDYIARRLEEQAAEASAPDHPGQP